MSIIRQPSLGHGKRRKPLPACVLEEIYHTVDMTARRFNVSRSFVIATALAHTFGIDDQPDYRIYTKKRKLKD